MLRARYEVRTRGLLVAAIAAVITAAGIAGLLLRGDHGSVVPERQRSAILERAKANGIIDHYRIRRKGLFQSDRNYAVDDDVFLEFEDGGCPGGPGASCPPGAAVTPRLFIEYLHPAYSKALAIERIARDRIHTILLECDPC